MSIPYVPPSGPSTLSQSSYSIRSAASRKPSIYDRNLNRTRGLELSHSAFTLLFAEMVSYTQNKVEGIAELERRYVIWKFHSITVAMSLDIVWGQRMLELIVWREKNSKRETRILGILQFIHTQVWKTLFGKTADSLEKSREHDDECIFSSYFVLLTGRYGS